MTAARRFRWRPVIAVLASVLLVSGCVGGTTDLEDPTADRLQKSVVQIAEVAATGKYAEALKSLEALQTQLTAATAKGEVGADRDARIRAAIEQVRADLVALIGAKVPKPTPPPEPEPEPAPEPEPEPEPTEKPKPDPAPDPTDEPTPDPTDEPDPEPTDEPGPEPTDEPDPDPTNEPVPEP